MKLFEHFLDGWNLNGIARLKELGREVKSDVKRLDNIISENTKKEHLIDQSLLTNKGLSLINNETCSQRIELKDLLYKEQGRERLKSIVLLNEMLLISQKNASHLSGHLAFLSEALESTEPIILALKDILTKKCSLLHDVKATSVLDIEDLRQQLITPINREKETTDELRNNLKEIHNQLADRVLFQYFGGNRGRPCPKCGMRYSEDRRERGLGNYFYCYFCCYLESHINEK